MNKTSMKTALAAALLFFSKSRLLDAQTCNYLAYESFGYPVAAPLHLQQGGTGWQEPWLVQNDDTTVPGFEGANSPAMSFSNLQTIGNHGSGGRVWLTTGRRLNTSATGPFEDYINSNGAIGEPGTVLWVSVLLRKNEANDEEVAAYWHSSGGVWCTDCSANKVAVGYFGANSNVSGQRRWTLRLHNNYYPTAVQVAAGATVFFVIRLEFTATQTNVAMYLNPSPIGNAGPPTTPTISQSTATLLEIRSFAAYLGNDPASGNIDEVRMATSFPCAAPDPGVPVNVPPTASFTISPPTGTAPLAVTLDGSASSDPDGTIASYSWDFGDGPQLGSGATVGHSYSAVGVIPITLTVTDNLGLEHSLTQTITVLDENGTFPCLLGLESEQLATCSAATGRFRVENWRFNAALTLRNPMNAVVPPAPGNANLYQNLAAGNYALTAAGATGCRDTFSIKIAVDSATCSGWSPNPCAMRVGTGLEGVAYWVPSRMFKDYFKTAGEWITYDPAGGGWSSGDLASMPIDENGYPTAIPFMAPGGPRAVRGILSALGHIPVGVPMRLLYDGTGTLVMQGAVSIQANVPGSIDFTCLDDGNIFFNMTSSLAADHVRNVRVVAVADVGSYLTQPFRAGFLEKCDRFACLRMMDLMGTNFNENVAWADRSKPGWYSQAATPGGGLAYEYIIQIANTLNKDIWVCVPHMADDDYIEQMALLFKNGLNPGLKVYLEYSNETWNWIFEQAHWVDQNGPDNLSYPKKYAERALHAFAIWHSVWGAEKSRVVRVFGTQNGYNWVTSEILGHADQDGYDAISPSWYFGLNHSATGVPNLQALGAAATAADVLANATNTFLNFYQYWQMVYRTAKLLDKKVVNYEGGQHFTDFSVPPYIQAMYDAQVLPGMYDLYDRALDSLRLLGSELPMSFVLCGPWESIYGSWGHVFDYDDPAPWADRPKFQVQLDQIALCPPPVPPAGVRLKPKIFLQGPYSSATGLMGDNLRSGGHLPTTSPYGDGSTVAAPVFNETGANAIVDWVKIELRSAATPATVLHTRSALVQRDGDVVALDGRSPVFFAGVAAGSYHVAIRHRNHLGIRTLAAVPLDGFASFLNFADGEIRAFGTNPMKVISGKYALYSGDASGNGAINAVDLNTHWRPQNGQPFNYATSGADLNMSGAVNAVDLNAHWRGNNSLVEQLD